MGLSAHDTDLVVRYYESEYPPSFTGISHLAKHAQQLPGLDRPATYRITVQGQLDERWSDWFGGMTVTVERKGDSVPTTTLTGTVTDQAALQGILHTLYSLGLPVCSVTCLGSGDETQAGASEGPEQKRSG